MSVRVQLLLILLFYRHCEKLDGLCLSEMIARYPKISNIKRWNARELWMMFQASRLVRFHENFMMMVDESDDDFGFIF